MSENKPKKLTIFLEKPLHKAAKIRLANAEKSFQQVFVELLTKWVSENSATDEAASRPAKVGGKR